MLHAMQWLKKIPEWVLGVVVLALLLLAAALVGEVYRKFQVLWACLWLSIPILAYVVSSGKLDAHLTEKGFRSLRVWLMVFAVIMSFIVFSDHDLKAKFGHYFFKGSEFWVANYIDTDGRRMISHEFNAPTGWGRFVLRAYDFVLFGLCLLLPYLLNRSFERSIRAKQQERYEQERLEYLRNNPTVDQR